MNVERSKARARSNDKEFKVWRGGTHACSRSFKCVNSSDPRLLVFEREHGATWRCRHARSRSRAFLGGWLLSGGRMFPSSSGAASSRPERAPAPPGDEYGYDAAVLAVDERMAQLWSDLRGRAWRILLAMPSTHFEPSSLELNGTFWRRNIRQANRRPCHPTHFEPLKHTL